MSDPSTTESIETTPDTIRHPETVAADNGETRPLSPDDVEAGRAEADELEDITSPE